MLDNFNRKINYLRISVTDRCNLRCIYCMPEEGIDLISHKDVLSFEEIVEFTKTAVSMGVTKVRLTGGEPLARRGCVDLVDMIAKIPGIKELTMTTNGTLLDKYAHQLKDAGLHRVNISLDSIDPDKYKAITRCGNVEDVFRGIEAAKLAGLFPIKINCVIKNSPNEIEAQNVKSWGNENGIQVRFIEEMNIEKGLFGVVHGGEGGDCANCNRLRLTSNGFIMPCLFSDAAINIREHDYKTALNLALEQKPECGLHGSSNKFYSIGG